MAKPRTQYNRATKKYEPVNPRLGLVNRCPVCGSTKKFKPSAPRLGLVNCCPVCGSIQRTTKGKRLWYNTTGGKSDGKAQ